MFPDYWKILDSRKATLSRLRDAIEAEAIENSPILEGEQATTFQSGTMRCAYLAQVWTSL